LKSNFDLINYLGKVDGLTRHTLSSKQLGISNFDHILTDKIKTLESSLEKLKKNNELAYNVKMLVSVAGISSQVHDIKKEVNGVFSSASLPYDYDEDDEDITFPSFLEKIMKLKEKRKEVAAMIVFIRDLQTSDTSENYAAQLQNLLFDMADLCHTVEDNIDVLESILEDSKECNRDFYDEKMSAVEESLLSDYARLQDETWTILLQLGLYNTGLEEEDDLKSELMRINDELNSLDGPEELTEHDES